MNNGIDPRVLSNLATFDGEVHQHRMMIGDGRRRERQLKALEVELAADSQGKKVSAEELKKENRRLEGEIEDLKTQAHRHGARLNEIQDTREYHALNGEIKYLLRQAEEKEEVVLANLEKIEQAENEWKEAHDAFEEKLSETRAEAQRIASQRKEHEQALHQAEKALEQYLSQVDDAVVRFYRRRAKRQEQPVVWMDKGACGYCHTRLTPQGRLEVLNGEKLVTCGTCGRVIVASNSEPKDSSVH